MYTVLAKASRLSEAASGSRHFTIFSSRVTITRLQRESSSAFASHLDKNNKPRISHEEEIKCKPYWENNQCKLAMFAYMKSSAAVWRWNWDFSSLGIDESISSPFENSMLPRCKIAATTRNIASWMVIGEARQKKEELKHRSYFKNCIMIVKKLPRKIPAPQNLFQQHPLLFLYQNIL